MGGNPGQMVAAAERWESRTKLKSTGWFASPTQQSRGSGETLKPEDYESLGLFHDRKPHADAKLRLTFGDAFSQNLGSPSGISGHKIGKPTFVVRQQT
jgi:hypothetical protein